MSSIFRALQAPSGLRQAEGGLIAAWGQLNTHIMFFSTVCRHADSDQDQGVSPDSTHIPQAGTVTPSAAPVVIQAANDLLFPLFQQWPWLQQHGLLS